MGYFEQLLISSEDHLVIVGYPISVTSVLGSNQPATVSLIFLLAYTNQPEDQLDDFAGE